MKFLIAVILLLSPTALLGQEPRLPGPAAEPSESEAMIQRARALVVIREPS